MPAENLPIQNINNSFVGYLFGSANSYSNTSTTSTYPFIIGKGNGYSGTNSFINGQANTMSGYGFNVLFGTTNNISGQFNFVHGSSNTISGGEGGGVNTIFGHTNELKNARNTFIVGCSNRIESTAGATQLTENNWVMGHSNYATGQANMIFGCATRLTGERNFLMAVQSGSTCNVSGNENFTFADRAPTNVSGNFNVSFGLYAPTEISGNSNFVAAYNTYVTGNYTTVFGYSTKFDNTQNNPYGTTVMGCYNATTSNNTQKIFIIGNGAGDDSRSDALTVDRSGETSAKDFIDENGKKLSETLPIHLVATVDAATAGYINGHVYIVTGSNS